MERSAISWGKKRAIRAYYELSALRNIRTGRTDRFVATELHVTMEKLRQVFKILLIRIRIVRFDQNLELFDDGSD